MQGSCNFNLKFFKYIFLRMYMNNRNFSRCLFQMYFVCRENPRTVMSLPVSPSSSPLRQRESTYQNSFFTPPHLSSSVARQKQNYSTANNILPYPPRPSPAFTLDPWLEDPFSVHNHEQPPPSFHCPPNHPAELAISRRSTLIH